MLKVVFSWILDEAVLQNFVQEFPVVVLLLIIAICIVILSKGADWMIDGVVHLARRTGLPRIVIGATIISLGTTTPEAVVSIMAAWMGTGQRRRIDHCRHRLNFWPYLRGDPGAG